jgi:hypothetical protein
MTQDEFILSEKIRVAKLYSTKHREGFSTREEFTSWYIAQLEAQHHKCYYCETSIHDIRKLIELGKLKPRATGYGLRGVVFEIDRKVNDKYTKENCVLSCYYCNNDKSYTLNADVYKKFFGQSRHDFFQYLLKST